MTSTSHIAQRLLTTYDDMPRGERKLADLLLEDVGIIGQSTAADLATQAGVSKATLYSYFPDKRLLFMEVADTECARQSRQAFDSIDTDAPPRVVLGLAVGLAGTAP